MVGNTDYVNGAGIRKTLEREIASRNKTVERHERNEAMDAAAHENAILTGLDWALFVLIQEHGI